MSEQQSIEQFSESAYLNYAMYVIHDRALPALADGLKPVQRRIIYAMSELGLSHQSKYKKSARTVGDVLGKFHPHGDSACYEAMVLLAQPFSYRYPLVDGQGNWGSIDDPKAFAAMRYTEAKLSRYAQIFLSELGQGTVDWTPNFDGSLKEPVTLPVRLPTVLLNGSSGIAVGMATDIPPHNLTEVVNACLYILDNPKASVKDLMAYIHGPDYPTNAEIITPKADVARMYETGQGSIKMRAVFEPTKDGLVVTALPYQSSGSKILEQIAAQMQAKKLPQIVDLRDESDHETPVRLVIVPKSKNTDWAPIISHLCASTDLEKSYRVNLNVLGLDKRPQVKSLDVMLKEWLVYRRQTVSNRLNHELKKLTARLHLLEGFLTAFLNIDEVIHIIRENDDPKPILMSRFKLSDEQATAILDLKLRHLAKLEEEKIQAESDTLSKRKQEIESILGSNTKLKNLLKKELKKDLEDFGDDRRSPLVEREASVALSTKVTISNDPVTMVLSERGWVRAVKGHDVDGSALNYKTGDAFFQQDNGHLQDSAIFMDSVGRTYSIGLHQMPSGRGLGEPLTAWITPPAGAKIIQGWVAQKETTILCASSSGYGFLTKPEHCVSKNKAGKALLRVPEGYNPLMPQIHVMTDDLRVALLSNQGRLMIIDAKELPELPKGKGNKLMSLSAGKGKQGPEILQAAVFMKPKDALQIIAGKRKFTLKPKDLDHYLGERAKRGFALPRGMQNASDLQVLK